MRKNDYSFYEPYEYAWYWEAPRSMIFSMYAIAAAELDDVAHAQEYFDLSYIDMKAPYLVFFELMENASSGGNMQHTLTTQAHATYLHTRTCAHMHTPTILLHAHFHSYALSCLFFLNRMS